MRRTPLTTTPRRRVINLLTPGSVIARVWVDHSDAFVLGRYITVSDDSSYTVVRQTVEVWQRLFVRCWLVVRCVRVVGYNVNTISRRTSHEFQSHAVCLHTDVPIAAVPHV